MKSIYKICFAAMASAGILASCAKKDLLDPTVVRTLNEELTFGDSVRTVAFVTAIYSELGANSFNIRYGNGGSLAEGSDESVSRLFGATQAWVPLMIGTLNSTRTTPYEKVYNNGWNNIRRANTFIKNFSKLPLAEETKNRLLGEVKFLRAWYFWSMVQHFGGLPIIGDKLYTLDDTILEPRATYADCIEYLVKELDEAADLLEAPDVQRPEDYGRVNKGFCMGLKARILLFAASDLYNGGQESIASAEQKPLIGYPSRDAARWTRAREAAEALINTGWYSLVENNTPTPGRGFYELFITRKNDEFIFPAMAGNNRTMEANFLPRSRNGNVNGCPSMNAAKRFGTNTGLPITDPASGYDPAQPFKNRDPRFNNTIINNGDKWRTSSTTPTPIWTYIGAETDGVDASLVYTGMFFRKFCNETSTANAGTNTDRVMPIIRYADILLMYAEAAIEENMFDEAAEKIILVRRRAGIKAGDGRYGLKATGDLAYWRSIIRNERAVELCLEDSASGMCAAGKQRP